MKSLPFETRHIKVVIQLPTDKHLDMNDSHDAREALKQIVKEWLEIETDVRSTLKIIKVEPRINVESLINENKKKAEMEFP